VDLREGVVVAKPKKQTDEDGSLVSDELTSVYLWEQVIAFARIADRFDSIGRTPNVVSNPKPKQLKKVAGAIKNLLEDYKEKFFSTLWMATDYARLYYFRQEYLKSQSEEAKKMHEREVNEHFLSRGFTATSVQRLYHHAKVQSSELADISAESERVQFLLNELYKSNKHMDLSKVANSETTIERSLTEFRDANFIPRQTIKELSRKFLKSIGFSAISVDAAIEILEYADGKGPFS